MNYTPQTMSETEMEQRLHDLLERAKALELAVLATDQSITDIIEETEISVDGTIQEMDVEFQALAQAELETEAALDALILREAAEEADE